MTPRSLVLIASITLTSLAGGVALSKEGVTDPTVQARNALMGQISGASRTLGDMASGKAAYDAAAAEAAKVALSDAAAKIAPAFEPQATDPLSEAKPEIWTNWADFVAKADMLVQAAAALDTSSAEAIGAGMGAVGGSCRSCHSDYRM